MCSPDTAQCKPEKDFINAAAAAGGIWSWYPMGVTCIVLAHSRRFKRPKVAGTNIQPVKY